MKVFKLINKINLIKINESLSEMEPNLKKYPEFRYILRDIMLKL